MEKLRILALSDSHGDSALLESISKMAVKEKVDLIVLCGDITGFNEKKGIIAPLKKANKPVIILHGNHETLEATEFIADLYKVTNLHGKSSVYNEVGIFGAGGADIGEGFISEKDLFNSLEKGHAQIKDKKKKVMITHMHPKGSKSELSGFEGSKAILKAIKKFQPDILLHGHIHEASGLEEKIGKTRVINVARQGKVIEL